MSNLLIYITVNDVTIFQRSFDWDWFLFDYVKNKDQFIKEHVLGIINNFETPKTTDPVKIYFSEDRYGINAAQYFSHLRGQDPRILLMIVKGLIDYVVDRVRGIEIKGSR